jgi:rod shape-determining protein MreD
MLKNALISILLCYFLVMLQTSFLVHFWTVNLIILAVVFVNIFEKQEKNLGLALAFAGGFLLDVFSSHFIGLYLSILLAAALFLKFILPKYITIPRISWI